MMKRIMKYFLFLLLLSITMLVGVKHNYVKALDESQASDCYELIEKTYSSDLTLRDCVGNSLGFYKVSTKKDLSWASIETLSYKLEAGTYYVAKDSIANKKYKIVISKALPKALGPISVDYKDNLFLKDIKLPNGWEWTWSYTSLTKAGTFYYEAKFEGNKNYKSDVVNVAVTVNKAHKDMPILNDITYSPYTKLSSISLPRGWYWANPSVVPTCDKEFYYANYDSISAYESDKFYDQNNVKVYLKTNKAKPTISSWPTASTITYGQNLFESNLENGCTNVKGTFNWKSPSKKPVCSNDGYMVIFAPQDSTNYKTISSKINLTVLRGVYGKASAPTIKFYSDTVVELQNQKGFEYSIDNGVTWQDSNIFDNLNEKTAYTFIARCKEDNNACAGGKSDSIEVKTKAHGPSAPTQPEFISQTNREVIFKQVENQEYSCDSGKTWQDSSAFTRLSSNKEYEFITRIKATQEVAAGEASQPIVVKTISSITYYNNIVKSLFSKIKFDFCKVFHVRLPKNVVEQ